MSFGFMSKYDDVHGPKKYYFILLKFVERNLKKNSAVIFSYILFLIQQLNIFIVFPFPIRYI